MDVSLVILLLCGIVLLIAGVSYLIYKKNVLSIQHDLNTILEKQSVSDLTIINLKRDLNDSEIQLQALRVDKALLEKEIDHLHVKINHRELNQENQIRQFENISRKVLEHQTHQIEQKNAKEIKLVLEPLQDKLVKFEKRIQDTHLESVKQSVAFKEQLKFLTEKTDSVSKEATNLAKALKGDYKQQGNWGELILESVLDKSGLEKDREYFVQSTKRDEQNRILRPDVVIHLPEARRMVIDSKVSLVAYEKAIATEIEDEEVIHLKAHSLAIKNHVDQLSAKDYHKLYGIKSPDFVLMFIPIDTAFSLALKSDPHLYQYAFDRNMVIVTPSTLLATLKTVDTMWRHEKQNKYALEIANEAGKMYDKFVGFVEDMIRIGKQLDTTKNSWHDSMKKLQLGKGNLLSRAERIKKLGANSSKEINSFNDK